MWGKKRGRALGVVQGHLHDYIEELVRIGSDRKEWGRKILLER